jgi:hypothetical protein
LNCAARPFVQLAREVRYSILVNKVIASKLYSKESLSDLDLDNNKGKGSSTYNTAFKLNIIAVYIFSTLVIYIKV